MAFEDDEQSVSDSAPIEIYEFTSPSTVYRYTSHDVDVTYDSDVYTAIPMLRSTIVRAGQGDPPELIIEMPTSTPIVAAYVPGPAPRNLAVTLMRLQGANVESWWDGIINAFSISKRTAKLRSPSLLDDPLTTSIPGISFQSLCNHPLYSTRCGVLRADFDQAATLSSVDGKDLVVSTVGGQADQWFKAGEVVHDASGERRLVVRQIGTAIKIASRFPSIAVSDALTLYAGCNHRLTTGCHDKFNNVFNFGGHHKIPKLNPFFQSMKGTGFEQ